MKYKSSYEGSFFLRKTFSTCYEFTLIKLLNTL